MMIEIDRKLLSDLFDKAVINPRLRQNFDLRNPDDNGQRILNALMPGTIVPIHRHPQSNETVIILCGKVIEIIYDDNGNEIERVHLDPSLGNFGCVVPTGAWHSVEVLEPTPTPSTFSNSLGDLKKNIEYIIGMECQSGNIETPTPQDIARILNVPVEEVRQCMKEMGL